jgi:hypothetical protein
MFVLCCTVPNELTGNPMLVAIGVANVILLICPILVIGIAFFRCLPKKVRVRAATALGLNTFVDRRGSLVFSSLSSMREQQEGDDENDDDAPHGERLRRFDSVSGDDVEARRRSSTIGGGVEGRERAATVNNNVNIEMEVTTFSLSDVSLPHVLLPASVTVVAADLTVGATVETSFTPDDDTSFNDKSDENVDNFVPATIGSSVLRETDMASTWTPNALSVAPNASNTQASQIEQVPQTLSTAAPQLPDGWAAHTTDDGAEYFHHESSGLTQWERPE